MPTDAQRAKFDIVIGLEVHAELKTKTKLFSQSLNNFGDPPNTNIDAVSLGLPGTLPVLNLEAVELGIRVGLALGSVVGRFFNFARKSYFYPDMPKNYQITQYDAPLNRGGELDLPSGRIIGIVRAHLEEDTGKITHIGKGGRIDSATHCLINYNRAGIPLLEIVSEPEIESAEMAREYVKELQAILVAVKASDGKMEEGSLRVDTNISVKPKGESELGTRCEIKNINSLRSLTQAIKYESDRQIELILAGKSVEQQTRHFNEETGETNFLRSKEDEQHYRYFPDPDFPEEFDFYPSSDWIKQIKNGMPQLPAARRKKLANVSGAEPEVVSLLVKRGVDGFVVDTIELFKGVNKSSVEIKYETALNDIEEKAVIAKAVKLAEQHLTDGVGQLTSYSFVNLLIVVGMGDISATQTKVCLTEMINSGKDLTDVTATKVLIDRSELQSLIDNLIKEHPEEWERYKEGDKKLEGFFVGEMMKLTQGDANGKIVVEVLTEKAKHS